MKRQLAFHASPLEHPHRENRTPWRVSLFLLLPFFFSPLLSSAQEASKLISPGPLTKGHEKYDNLRGCLKCHKVGKGVPDEKCLECHKKISRRIAARKGLHRSLEKPCYQCHTDHKGKDFSIIELDRLTFDHARTGYALKGKHIEIQRDCKRCHRKKSFLEASRDCQSCHKQRHKGSVEKRVCTDCHTTQSWKVINFDHGKTEFALKGAHKNLFCKKCHQKIVFTKLKKNCQDCHFPKHKDQFKGKTCTECHSSSSWTAQRFAHEKTRFPLKGEHQLVGCTQCHGKKRPEIAKGEAITCRICHRDRHRGQFKVAKEGGLEAPEPCTSCHSEKGWKPALFDHNRSRFKLEGKHRDVSCRLCHGRGRYKPLELKCSSCHKDKHRGQFKVEVEGKEVVRPCADCHKPMRWKPSTFDHKTSKFKLEGKHKDVSCATCHKRGKYKSIETNCTNCHRDAHKGQFKTRKKKVKECSECHAPKGWKPTLFDHDRSRFKLAGAHKKVTCGKCHPGKKFKPLDTRCTSCHRDKHQGKFGRKCERCHNSTSWKLKTDFHKTIFPLTGAHEEIVCADCHQNTRTYSGLASRCVTCHIDPHENRFGSNCSDCHNDAAWLPSTFTHNQTGFLLLGAHGRASCEQCHEFDANRPVLETTSGAPTFSCYSCHEQDYLGARNPNHVQSDYSAECQFCHQFDQGSWGEGEFNHNSAAFPLVGKHESVACEKCHLNDQYRGTPKECYSCHWEREQADRWNLQLGNECQKCHTPYGWGRVEWSHGEPPASFELEGLHRNEPCLSCHQGYQAQGTSRECLSCHQSDYDATTGPNHLQAGYSTNCGTCHKFSDTSWNQGVFDHSLTGFPLLGGHFAVPCEQCHLGGQFSGTPRDCYTCHWERSQDDPWGLQIGQDCGACHDPSGWLPTRWSHSEPPASWPLEGVHAERPCLACHQNYQAQGTSTACYGCHQEEYEQTQDPDHQILGFPTDCNFCHSVRDRDWLHGSYDHAWYPLGDRHSRHRCYKCHPIPNNFDLGNTRCLTCHNRKHKEDPCARCHYVDDWKHIR